MFLAYFTIFLFFNVVFFISIWRQDNGVADIAWGLSFVIFAWMLYWASDFPSATQIVMTLLVTIWGLRLSTYIFLRNRKSQGEDFRYKNWRAEWGARFLIRSYFQVYMLQMLVMFIIALPIVFAYLDCGIDWFYLVPGTFLALFGLIYEAVADWQLAHFKSFPAHKGKLMTQGLWAYSRHPNYFGEALFWWGVAMLVLYANYGYLALLSPLALTLLLRFVSGVPMLEKKYAGRSDFKAYCAKTKCLVPFIW